MISSDLPQKFLLWCFIRAENPSIHRVVGPRFPFSSQAFFSPDIVPPVCPGSFWGGVFSLCTRHQALLNTSSMLCPAPTHFPVEDHYLKCKLGTMEGSRKSPPPPPPPSWLPLPEVFFRQLIRNETEKRWFDTGVCVWRDTSEKETT